MDAGLGSWATKVAAEWRRATVGLCAAKVALDRFRRDRVGGVALTFGLVAPVLLVMAAASIQYAYMSAVHADLQAAADEASLASARQLTVGYVNDANVYNTASAMVRAHLGYAATVDAQISTDRTTVTVVVSEPSNNIVGNLVFVPPTLSARSVAKAVGSAKVCIVGLERTQADTISLKQTSALSAPQCSIFSNSSNVNGVDVKDSASIRADVVCTAGSYNAQSGSGVVPAPITGCPQVDDPLASYPQPPVGGCTSTKYEATQGNVTLYPGVYCGGLHIGGKANATLSQGVYIITGGDLNVDGNASISGNYVGFFMSGGAKFNFSPNTIISLAAPKSGPLAGFLFFEDRADPTATHQINSSGARQLLGTIYLPNGILHIGSKEAVADVSAYTVIVARQLQIEQASNLVLNVNYGATDVPVPHGVGPVGGKITLAE